MICGDLDLDLGRGGGNGQLAKPNRIDPELVGNGGQQRNDDEHDLEELRNIATTKMNAERVSGRSFGPRFLAKVSGQGFRPGFPARVCGQGLRPGFAARVCAQGFQPGFTARVYGQGLRPTRLPIEPQRFLQNGIRPKLKGWVLSEGCLTSGIA